MSPVPSVATAFALSSAAPSTALDPGVGGQSASETSQLLIGTGSPLFAVVVFVAVAKYFRGRGTCKSARSNNTWPSFLSSVRHRDLSTTSTATATATDWPADLEVGPEQHVSMVYARFFHPTSWNLVECHPATPSAPAIHVEDEANEIPESDPRPPGMIPSSDMDGCGNEHDDPQHARETPDRVARAGVEEVPPYDASSVVNVNFTSEIIGTTHRPDAFLSVPGEGEDDSSGSSFSVQEEPVEPSSDALWAEFDLDFGSLAYDGITTSPPRSSATRRYGMANMRYLVQDLKDAIPEEGRDLVPTFSFRTGLSDLSQFLAMDTVDDSTVSNRDGSRNGRSYSSNDAVPQESDDLVPTISRRTGLLNISQCLETNPIVSCTFPEEIQPVGEERAPKCEIGVCDTIDDWRSHRNEVDTPAAAHEGIDIMRRLLAELRDPSLDWNPRAFSENSDCDYSDDEEEEATIPRLTLTDYVRRNSLGSDCSTLGTDSDVSDEGPIYPSTPPLQSASASSIDRIPGVHVVYVASRAPPWFKEKVQVVSPTSLDSPPSLPTKAHVRTRRDSRSLLFGPRLPLLALPRL